MITSDILDSNYKLFLASLSTSQQSEGTLLQFDNEGDVE